MRFHLPTRLAAFVFLAGCLGAILFHLGIIAGMPWGDVTMGGRWPGQVPPEGRASAAISIITLTLIGFVMASAAGLTVWQARPWMVWGTVAYMALAVVLHIITPSVMERTLWLPPIAIMFASALYVAIMRTRSSPDR